MTPDKERIRKAYDIREPKEPADPGVLRRNPLHRRIAMLQAKWLMPINLIFITLAFVIVLLPIMRAPWLATITNMPVIIKIHQIFSEIGWPYFLSAIPALLGQIYRDSKKDGKLYSEHGYPINIKHAMPIKNIIAAELYPLTKEEERVFWVDSFCALYTATILWFVIFGALTLLYRTN